MGNFRKADSVSKPGGILLKISAATLWRISSSDLPPPDDVRDWEDKIKNNQNLNAKLGVCLSDVSSVHFEVEDG